MQRLILALIALLAVGAGALLALKALAWRNGFRSYKAQFQDFGGIATFSAANAKLSASGDRLDAVFLGASHTLDWGDLRQSFPGLRLANRGISGQAIPQYLVRFRQDVLDLHPKVVVIEGCAVNTTYGLPVRAVVDSYASMAELARIHGIEPILATITPVSSSLERREPGTNDEIRKINEAIREVAARGGYRVVDYYSAVAGPDGTLPAAESRDGLHCDQKVYNRMAELLRPVLKEALEAAEPAATAERGVRR
jgi:lysophospholipase L1-like esterase